MILSRLGPKTPFELLVNKLAVLSINIILVSDSAYCQSVFCLPLDYMPSFRSTSRLDLPTGSLLGSSCSALSWHATDLTSSTSTCMSPPTTPWMSVSEHFPWYHFEWSGSLLLGIVIGEHQFVLSLLYFAILECFPPNFSYVFARLSCHVTELIACCQKFVSKEERSLPQSTMSPTATLACLPAALGRNEQHEILFSAIMTNFFLHLTIYFRYGMDKHWICDWRKHGSWYWWVNFTCSCGSSCVCLAVGAPCL